MKSPFSSKAFVLNLIVLIVGLLTGLLNIDLIKNNATAVLVIGLVVAFLNGVIRLYSTATPITLSALRRRNR